MSDTPYIPQRIMAIVAHPDDIEFGAAGTIARWVQAGAEVAYVVCTSGEVGIATPGMTKERAAEIREAEQRAAAAVVGVTDVVFLREPDGMLENTLSLRKRLVREIRRFKPEVVVTGDPTAVFVSPGGINHPDHRAASGAAVDAVFPAAGQPNLFEELAAEELTAHKVRKLYITGRGQGDVFINITTTIDLKIKALQQHVSQVGEWEGLEARIRDWTATIGQGKEMQHAEAFRVITLVGDEDWQAMQAGSG
ncbi:MAG: PIG-L deacetylase family protein [Anaerolineae bacterium]